VCECVHVFIQIHIHNVAVTVRPRYPSSTFVCLRMRTYAHAWQHSCVRPLHKSSIGFAQAAQRSSVANMLYMHARILACAPDGNLALTRAGCKALTCVAKSEISSSKLMTMSIWSALICLQRVHRHEHVRQERTHTDSVLWHACGVASLPCVCLTLCPHALCLTLCPHSSVRSRVPGKKKCFS
jgi:hypothetical protein